jgi:RND family efflux transporter MFP subunit
MKSPVLAFFSLALLLIAGCSRGPRQSEVQAASRKPQPLTVAVASAQTRQLERTISVTGSLIADESVTISPEISGRVVSIHADFGQSVRKGDVIAELDGAEYQIQLERARAALNQALARLGLRPGDEMQPPATTANLRQAQAQLEDAKFKFESAQRLVKSGDISQERFTEIEKSYRARQAAFDAAQDELRMSWMNVESLRAEVKLAEKHLSDTVLHAPFDGSVSQRHVSPGQYVHENTAIVTLVKTRPLRLRVDIPEGATAFVRPGTSLSFTTDAAPGAIFRATVRELNPSLDPKNRSLTAEARLDAPDPRLRPGGFVQVQLVTDRAADSVMVPKQAVYTVAGLTKVFSIRDGRAVEHRVSPGREIDGWMEVPASVIRAGDQVAVSNVFALIDGAEVKTEGR